MLRIVLYIRDVTETKTVAIYRVYESDLAGWTVETLAAALEGPLNKIGVEVESYEHVSGGKSLLITDDEFEYENPNFRDEVERIVERVVVDGE